jgi:hypothetical protein
LHYSEKQIAAVLHFGELSLSFTLEEYVVCPAVVVKRDHVTEIFETRQSDIFPEELLRQ